MDIRKFARTQVQRAQTDDFFSKRDWKAARERLGSRWFDTVVDVVAATVGITSRVLAEHFGTSLVPAFLEFMSDTGSGAVTGLRTFPKGDAWNDDTLSEMLASWKQLSHSFTNYDFVNRVDPVPLGQMGRAELLGLVRRSTDRRVEYMADNFLRAARSAQTPDFLEFYEYIKNIEPRVGEYLMRLRKQTKGSSGKVGDLGELATKSVLASIAATIETMVNGASESQPVFVVVKDAMGSSVVGYTEVSASVVMNAYSDLVRTAGGADVTMEELTSAHMSLLIKSAVDAVKHEFHARSASDDMKGNVDDIAQRIVHVPTVAKFLEVLRVLKDEGEV